MAAPSFDASSSGTATEVSSKTVSHIIGSGANRILIVFAASEHTPASVISSITYNGADLTEIGVRQKAEYRHGVWYLLNPDSGTHDIVVTWSNTMDQVAVIGLSYEDAKQEGPEASAKAAGFSSNIDVSVTTITDNARVVGSGLSGSFSTMSPDSGQTEREDIAIDFDGNGPITLSGGDIIKVSAGVQAMNWDSGFANFTVWALSLAPVPVPTVPINPSRYAIVLTDKDGNVKKRLEHVTTRAKWAWLDEGGCGRASLTFDGDYLRFTIEPDDEIQIWMPNVGSGATLVYRGFAEDGTPALGSGNRGKISVRFNGYFAQLDRILVQAAGISKTYTSQGVSSIVEDIIDTFIIPNTNITKGTIDASTFVPDSISFKTSAKEALRTLAALENVEYGVDAERVFFWRNRVETLSHKFYLGHNVIKINDRIEFKKIRNKIYLEGGNVAGSAFALNAFSQSSITRFKLRERIESDGSITTTSVGNHLLSRLLKREAKPQQELALNIRNSLKRLEATVPIGAVSFVDPESSQTSAIYGTTGNGGSNKLYGTIGNSGSGQLYGGVPKSQVRRIDYDMSPEEGRLDFNLQFGETDSVSLASITIKQIQTNLNAARTRQL